MKQKMIFKLADVFNTPVDTDNNETIRELLSRMDAQGRFDFKSMQSIILLLCEELDQKE